MISEKKVLVKSRLLKEKHIPSLIIWVPIVSIIITAIIISILFIVSYRQFLDIEGEVLKERLLDEGNSLIRDETDEIIDYIEFKRSYAEEGLTADLKNRIIIAYSIIESIYEYNHEYKTDEEIINIIRDTLRNVRFFDGRGYYFIHRHDLNSSDYTILQPDLPHLEGDYQLDYVDLDGRNLAKITYSLLESEKEGFLSFHFYLDDQIKKEKKLVYMKLFEPLNISIGTGDYLIFFEEKIKADVLNWVKNYRYGDDNYFYIFNNLGKVIMHPITPELVGQNIGDFKDSKGYVYGHEYINSPDLESGVYVKYVWLHPDTGREELKIGYAKYYKDWDWNIGTGIYMYSLEELIQERQNNLSNIIRMVTYKTIIFVGLLIFVVFIGTIIFAKFTVSLFAVYNQNIRESSGKLQSLNLSLEKKVKEKTVELEKKNKELELIATTDSLTDIYNRRYFDYIFDKEWHRHIRNKNEISLIMCDIDFFKQFNDTYGHQKGDECLKIVGRILKKACKRPTDITVRYGGEEFALILPNTDLNGAIKIAASIQSEINKQHILHESSGISNILTISFGVSSVIPWKAQEYPSLIKRADAALYIAKANGRDRIEF